MKASEILPFTIAMGALTLFLYFISGDASFIGQNIAYLTVTIFVLILWRLILWHQKVEK